MAIVAATDEAIAEAGAVLRGGALVAFPTETVYGLGCDATNGRAVAAVFAAKGRPSFNPLIVHVAGIAAAEGLADLTPLARRLAEAFWPGPLTLVLPRRMGSGISELATAGLDTLALRMPDHPIALALLRAADRPIAAPSANRSGRVSPTQAAHVAADLGASVAMILDCGPTRLGLESTVLDLSGDLSGDRVVLLRPGAVTAEAIEAVLGTSLPRHQDDAGDKPRSPGLLARHYAPATRLRLGAVSAAPGEALLAFGPNAPPASGPVINLSPSGDLTEAAASLFAALRALDAEGASAIAVMPIPEHGLGEAINDRLRRAAHS